MMALPAAPGKGLLGEATGAVVGAGGLLGAALYTSQSVRKALGPSGRTAMVAIPFFGFFFLKSELYMLKCGRKVSDWKRSVTNAEANH